MTKEQKIYLAYKCGLQVWEENEEEIEFIGTDKQWKKFQEELDK